MKWFVFIQKVGCVQGLIFLQIMFEKCSANFCFENDEVGIKTTIANLYSLLVWNVPLCLHTFSKPPFQQKPIFTKLVTAFILSTRCNFTILWALSETSTKVD